MEGMLYALYIGEPEVKRDVFTHPAHRDCPCPSCTVSPCEGYASCSPCLYKRTSWSWERSPASIHNSKDEHSKSWKKYNLIKTQHVLLETTTDTKKRKYRKKRNLNTKPPWASSFFGRNDNKKNCKKCESTPWWKRTAEGESAHTRTQSVPATREKGINAAGRRRFIVLGFDTLLTGGGVWARRNECRPRNPKTLGSKP